MLDQEGGLHEAIRLGHELMGEAGQEIIFDDGPNAGRLLTSIYYDNVCVIRIECRNSYYAIITTLF